MHSARNAENEHGISVDPFPRRRLVGFVGLHLLAFGAQVLAMVNFAVTGDDWFFSLILLPFLLSGLFCAHAAWQCDAPHTGSGYLPLKRQPLCKAVVLLLPLGLGQGIILQLAFEEYRARQREALAAEDAAPPRTAANKFHCKAVNGLFEGLPSSAVIFYAFWTMGYPTHDPITLVKWPHEGDLLCILGLISFVSSGLGLLELDFCTSKAISKRMQRSTVYEILHGVFRTTEVASRVSLFINFMISTRAYMWWWWLPLAADFAVTFVLITVFGGVETTSLVRLLCSIPCVFANVFLFMDSPIKRRAASRVTWWLTIKHFLELFILPGLVFLEVQRVHDDLRCNWEMHENINILMIVAQVLYWVLFWWITSQKTQRHSHMTSDIFSACHRGSNTALRSAIKELSHSAAIGLNINIFDIDGNTPLFLAAARGHTKICRHLLREGALVHVRIFGDNRRRYLRLHVRRRWTPLHVAAYKGHLEVVRVLVQSFRSAAVPEADDGSACLTAFQDRIRDTPLHVAVRAGHVEVTRLLMGSFPSWAEERNCRGERPSDLAPVNVKEAMDEVMLHPPGTMTPPGRQSSGSLPRIDVQQWPQVQLPIARSSREGALMAPGLSSYIASSCGGALGRVFLSAEVRWAASLPVSHNSSASVLVDESLNASLLSDRLSGSLLVDGTPVDSSPQSAPETTLSDLVPIDGVGQPVRWWQEMAQAQQLQPITSGAALARSFVTQVPEEAILGEGSYGLVWRAQDRNTKRWYAVKNIRTRRGSTSSLAMNECDVADRIRLRPHPCLVYLFLVHKFTDSGVYALVMEFCPGGDVLNRIRFAREAGSATGAYRPPTQALRWIGQIFLGLEHMHLRMDTLLRDLKPENVVLTETGCAKLTDFGFGRFGVEAAGCWSFGIPTGSPGYVAPEILKQEEYDYRADLYSLGVLAWVLFTGGLTNRPEPQPPMGIRRHGGDFQAHYQDSLLLARCVRAPELHFARPLKSAAREFVLGLIDRQDTRMKHAQIRQHRFLQPAQLPDFNAQRSVVNAWCGAIHELE